MRADMTAARVGTAASLAEMAETLASVASKQEKMASGGGVTSLHMAERKASLGIPLQFITIPDSYYAAMRMKPKSAGTKLEEDFETL